MRRLLRLTSIERIAAANLDAQLMKVTYKYAKFPRCLQLLCCFNDIPAFQDLFVISMIEIFLMHIGNY